MKKLKRGWVKSHRYFKYTLETKGFTLIAMQIASAGYWVWRVRMRNVGPIAFSYTVHPNGYCTQYSAMRGAILFMNRMTSLWSPKEAD